MFLLTKNAAEGFAKAGFNSVLLVDMFMVLVFIKFE